MSIEQLKMGYDDSVEYTSDTVLREIDLEVPCRLTPAHHVDAASLALADQLSVIDDFKDGAAANIKDGLNAFKALSGELNYNKLLGAIETRMGQCTKSFIQRCYGCWEKWWESIPDWGSTSLLVNITPDAIGTDAVSVEFAKTFANRGARDMNELQQLTKDMGVVAKKIEHWSVDHPLFREIQISAKEVIAASDVHKSIMHRAEVLYTFIDCCQKNSKSLLPGGSSNVEMVASFKACCGMFLGPGNQPKKLADMDWMDRLALALISAYEPSIAPGIRHDAADPHGAFGVLLGATSSGSASGASGASDSVDSGGAANAQMGAQKLPTKLAWSIVGFQSFYVASQTAIRRSKAAELEVKDAKRLLSMIPTDLRNTIDIPADDKALAVYLANTESFSTSIESLAANVMTVYQTEMYERKATIAVHEGAAVAEADVTYMADLQAKRGSEFSKLAKAQKSWQLQNSSSRKQSAQTQRHLARQATF